MATKPALTWEQFLAAGKPDRRWEEAVVRWIKEKAHKAT